MNVSPMGVEEMARSLNGFDDIATAKKFGADSQRLYKQDEAVKALRALIFVHYRREGLDDDAAYEAAMTHTLGEVEDFFTDDEVTLDGDEPETEQGKGLSPSGEPTTSSPTGAS